MKDIPFKLTLLSRIAKELNNRNITWAVGASMLLYFKGITSEFHDIDIMVSEHEYDLAKEVLLSMGEIQPPDPNDTYRTRYFGEFLVDGVDIDMIAGFRIIDKDKEYYFPLEQGTIVDFSEINGIRIPLQSVEDWLTYYKLMGRLDKVKMINDWTNKN